MKIRFINPFQYGDFRNWDYIIQNENDEIILRVIVQFKVDSSDEEIILFGEDYFYSQGFESYETITIDKPENWN